MSKNLTTNRFIEKAVAVHSNRYNYSLVEYKNNRTKVEIVCREHGSFFQSPNSHMSGSGCPECCKKNRSLSSDRFVEKARNVHGEKYDYSKIKYKNYSTKIEIVCSKHGSFFQRPGDHVCGYGCPRCGGNAKKNNQDFIARAKSVHDNKYDYSRIKYQNAIKKVEIVCADHGAFFQRPGDHLCGNGCPECVKHTRDDFIRKALCVHGDRYDYSMVEYVNTKTKVHIICPDHGNFYQTPKKHLCGSGCPECAVTGFKDSLPAILYYLEIETDKSHVYKIGITNRSIQERYPLMRDRKKFKVLKTWEYPLGSEARKMERKIIKKHKDSLYQGDPPLEGVGTAEMFLSDVLMIEHQKKVV